MPSVTFDGQSFSVQGRRIWLSARELQYSLVPAAGQPDQKNSEAAAAEWSRHLRAARQAGFNTIVAACPWSLHEPRAGQTIFTGVLDVRRFAELCGTHGLWLILRIGPVVGRGFDGGGLPAWLSDLPAIRLREANPVFMDRVTRWFRGLAEQVATFQATAVAPKAVRAARPTMETGPIIAIQIEADWRCGVESTAKAYLSELVRFAREVGFAIPILTANQSFAMVETAIDTLTVEDDALSLMRQLAMLTPTWPRLATVISDDPIRQLALTLAGAAQFIVGESDSSGRPGALRPGVSRVAQFASSFGHVFAQVDGTTQSIVADPETTDRTDVIPVTGSGGSAAFVMRSMRSGKMKASDTITLMLPEGRRLTAPLGAAPVSWYLTDVELGGNGVLDYASATPFAFVDKRVIAFVGPANTDVEVSINKVPLSIRVPNTGAGAKPVIERVRDIIVVMCNEAQADAALVTDDALIIGAASVGEDGAVTLARGFRGAVRITRSGVIEPITKNRVSAAGTAKAATVTVHGWLSSPQHDMIDGESQRYATLGAPISFSSSGARQGYGWYRATFKRATAAKVMVHAPHLADRATVWLDGERLGTFGRGAEPFPLELKLTAKQHTLVALVEADDRPPIGDYIGRRTGLFGTPMEVALLKVGPKIERGIKANAFKTGAFLYEKHESDLNGGITLLWKVTQKKPQPLVLDMSDAANGEERGPFTGATITVDGTTVARWNHGGPEGLAAVIDQPSTPSTREIRLVLDDELDDKDVARLLKTVRLFEAVQPMGGTAKWSFARWTPPTAPWGDGAKTAKYVPTWSRGTFALRGGPSDSWLDVSSIGRGQAFVNGYPLGRFAARDASGKVIAGDAELLVPAPYLVAEANELVIFDELGLSPKSVALRVGEA
ncbi:MAG: beta-galactosidase [Phycisphaerae bacterium]|nr:beta-galactosidase [Phycisphaerae bacterium]